MKHLKALLALAALAALGCTLTPNARASGTNGWYTILTCNVTLYTNCFCTNDTRAAHSACSDTRPITLFDVLNGGCLSPSTTNAAYPCYSDYLLQGVTACVAFPNECGAFVNSNKQPADICIGTVTGTFESLALGYKLTTVSNIMVSSTDRSNHGFNRFNVQAASQFVPSTSNLVVYYSVGPDRTPGPLPPVLSRWLENYWRNQLGLPDDHGGYGGDSTPIRPRWTLISGHAYSVLVNQSSQRFDISDVIAKAGEQGGSCVTRLGELMNKLIESTKDASLTNLWNDF